MFAAASGELHVGDADVWCVEGNMTRVLECLIDYLGEIQVGGELLYVFVKWQRG